MSLTIESLLADRTALRKRVDDLEAVILDVAQMQMIDAEADGDRIVYRFWIPGRKQMFNAPRFVANAKRIALERTSDRDAVQPSNEGAE